MAKTRLDQLLVQRGLADSREKAQRLIRAGQIKVDHQPATKPGHSFDNAIHIELREPPRYVGRGGEKLAHAFESFSFDVRGKVCLDLGSSTGGFTDCLLQHGAARVIAVDVGKGQLDWKLRNDQRVTVMEGVNARYLAERDLPELPSIVVADVSFISLTKVLPAVTQFLDAGAELVTLVKPQFEAGREYIEKGGVVRRPEVHEKVLQEIRAFGENELGLLWIEMTPSPLKGPAGNIEFLVYWKKL